MSVHPAIARAQRHAKGTRKQMEEDRKRQQQAIVQHNDPVIRRKSNKPMNAAAAIRNMQKPPGRAPVVVKPRKNKKPTRKELIEQKNKRITPEERRKINANKRQENTQSRRPPPPNRAKQRNRPRKQRVMSPDKHDAANHAKATRKGFKHGTRVVTVEHKEEEFGEYKYVKKGKTAKQLLEEKRQAVLAKRQKQLETDDSEYERLKKKRLKEDRRVRKAKKKKVVKAKITDKRQVTRKGAEDDRHKKYKIEYEEEEMDSWDSDIEIKPKHIKEIDTRENRRRVDNAMQRIGKGADPSDKIKVRDQDKERFVLEDLAGSKKSKSKRKGQKLPVVDISDLNKIINSRVADASRRDILLVGLSESAKDTIIDCIMDTKLGLADKIFDTTLEENEDEDIPDDNIAIFSEKVPILPLDKRDGEDSDEDGTQARRRALAKKKKLAEEEARARQKSKSKNKPKKKVVVARAEETYEAEDFILREDYPSVRFVVLTKVSANDRVDVRGLHMNVARFVPYERFKNKFKKLNRYECLIIDQNDKRQIYRMEFE